MNRLITLLTLALAMSTPAAQSHADTYEECIAKSAQLETKFRYRATRAALKAADNALAAAVNGDAATRQAARTAARSAARRAFLAAKADSRIATVNYRAALDPESAVITEAFASVATEKANRSEPRILRTKPASILRDPATMEPLRKLAEKKPKQITAKVDAALIALFAAPSVDTTPNAADEAASAAFEEAAGAARTAIANAMTAAERASNAYDAHDADAAADARALTTFTTLAFDAHDDAYTTAAAAKRATSLSMDTDTDAINAINTFTIAHNRADDLILKGMQRRYVRKRKRAAEDAYTAASREGALVARMDAAFTARHALIATAAAADTFTAIKFRAQSERAKNELACR